MGEIKYHQLDQAAYDQAVFNLLKLSEGDKLQAYVDTKGIPTIGIGFNLHDPTVYDLVIKSVAPDLTSDEASTLFDAIKGKFSSAAALNSTIDSVLATFKDDNPKAPTSLAFSSTDQTKSVFNQAKKTYENRVNNWLAGIPNSTERAALVSLAYNGLINTGKSPTLRGDIADGNRAEAWYEIRYDSNGGSDDLANRRYLEANSFGLYDDATKPSQADALQAAQTYTDHRGDILNYETDDSPSTAAINKKTPSIKDIYQELMPAVSTLKGEFKIPGSFPIQEVQAATDDTPNLNGDGSGHDTAKNEQDLLIGSDADNVISGGKGDDAIVGGAGDDTIDGGSGSNDTVFYKGKPSDYDIDLNKDGSWTVSDVRGAATDGTDTLTNVEFVQFGDGTRYALKPNGIKDQKDFAFVVDTTGSMGPYIGAVQDDARSLIASAFAGGNVDARIGVVSFKDPTQGDPNSVVLDFTGQTAFADRQAAAVSAIGTLGADGGGDIPETDEAGLLLALDGSMGKWRPSAGSRDIVLFSDAPVKDTDLASTVNAYAHDQGVVVRSSTESSAVGPRTTLSSFVLASSTAGDDSAFNINIYTIQVGSDESATASLAKIAADNGGQFLTAPTPADLISALSSVIDTTTPVTTDDGALSIDPSVTYKDGVFTFNGAVRSSTASSVEISATVDGTVTDLGSATLNGDGTFTFLDRTGPHLQGFITATETDGDGSTVSSQAGFSLMGAQSPGGKAEQVVYGDDGESVSSTSRFLADGRRSVDVRAAGQTVTLQPFDIVSNNRQPNSNFIFDAGDGLSVIKGFKLGGADHDTLELPSSDFASIADVLRNTGDIGGSAFITDPKTGDAIRLAGVTTAELKTHPRDLVLHA